MHSFLDFCIYALLSAPPLIPRNFCRYRLVFTAHELSATSLILHFRLARRTISFISTFAVFSLALLLLHAERLTASRQAC